MTEQENHFWAEIDTFALPESEMGKKDLSEQEIFSIRCQHGSIHGPFLLSELKDALQNNPAWRNFSIRPLNKQYWIPLGEHPLFDQRSMARKTLLQSLDPEKSNIHLNIKGQTSGPYSLKEIEEKFTAGELLPCDLINIDPEQPIWIRLFEIPHFNPKKALPAMPQDHILENTAILSKDTNQADAMIGLAQLEKKIKSSDTPPKITESSEPTTDFSETIKGFWNKSSFAIAGFALLAVVMAASLPLFQQKSPQKKTAKIEKPIVKRKPIARKKPKIKRKPWKPPVAKAKAPPKFFPTPSHSVIPEPPPVEQDYEEDFETPPEPIEPEYGDEELINAIESYPDNKKRNPSSIDGYENDGLGEAPDSAKDGFFEEDIEFEPAIPKKQSYDR